MKLYAFHPKNPGPKSLFVMADNPRDAKVALDEYVNLFPDWGSEDWADPRYFDMEMVGPGVVLVDGKL